MIQILRYTEALEKAGFSTEQARSTVQLWTDFMEHNFATKTDLMELAHKQEMSMKNLEAKFTEEAHSLRLEIRKQGSDLTIKMGIMMATSIGIVSTIVSLSK
jgi:hypothetical protein